MKANNAEHPDYSLILRRAAFIILIIGVLVAPHITAPNPRPPFNVIRGLLTLPFPIYVAVGVAAFVIYNVARRSLRNKRDPIKPDSWNSVYDPIATLPIAKAVTMDGGNGLASRRIELHLQWKVIGWIHVQTPGSESVVIDRTVIRRSRLFFARILAFHKELYYHRILMKPEPLPLSVVSERTKDKQKWHFHVDINVIYGVNDPRQVVGGSALAELESLVRHEIALYIRSQTQAILLSDQGAFSAALEKKLTQSHVVKGLRVERIALLRMETDERVLEKHRKEAEAQASLQLVRIEGQSEFIKEVYRNANKKMQAELQEWIAQNDHRRVMETMGLNLEAANWQVLMRVIGQIARSGIDPLPLLNQLKVPYRNSNPEAENETLLQMEQRMLQENQASIGYKNFKVLPHEQNSSLPGEARIHLGPYGLLIRCGLDYPKSRPQVEVHELKTPDRKIQPLILRTYDPQGMLVGVIITSIMQLNLPTSTQA